MKTLTLLDIVIFLMIPIVILSLACMIIEPDYKEVCRNHGGVPVKTGSRYITYNCFNNTTKEYIDIETTQ